MRPSSRTARRSGSPSPAADRWRSTCRGGCRTSSWAGRCRPSASSTRGWPTAAPSCATTGRGVACRGVACRQHQPYGRRGPRAGGAARRRHRRRCRPLRPARRLVRCAARGAMGGTASGLGQAPGSLRWVGRGGRGGGPRPARARAGPGRPALGSRLGPADRDLRPRGGCRIPGDVLALPARVRLGCRGPPVACGVLRHRRLGRPRSNPGSHLRDSPRGRPCRAPGGGEAAGRRHRRCDPDRAPRPDPHPLRRGHPRPARRDAARPGSASCAGKRHRP